MDIFKHPGPGLLQRHPGAEVDELGHALSCRPGDCPGEEKPVLQRHDAK
jgi:hypothetical protein